MRSPRIDEADVEADVVMTTAVSKECALLRQPLVRELRPQRLEHCFDPLSVDVRDPTFSRSQWGQKTEALECTSAWSAPAKESLILERQRSGSAGTWGGNGPRSPGPLGPGLRTPGTVFHASILGMAAARFASRVPLHAMPIPTRAIKTRRRFPIVPPAARSRTHRGPKIWSAS